MISKSLLIGTVAFFCAFTALSQDVIISEGSVLIKESDGIFIEVEPEPLYLHDSVEMGMTLKEAREIGLLSSEVELFTYRQEHIFEDVPVDTTYEFNVIDLNEGAVLTNIHSDSTEAITEDTFRPLYELVKDKLDGVPVESSVVVPEQRIEFEYRQRFELDPSELEYVYTFTADGGVFTMELQYDQGYVTLSYDSFDYLLDDHLRNN